MNYNKLEGAEVDRNKEQLRIKSALDLDHKILLSKNVIREWYNYHSGNVVVSFSGGKDSTVLLHLVRSVYPNVKGVFSDTGLEYPEIRSFVQKTDNIDWVRPKRTFKEIIDQYGYPLISKEVSRYVYYAKVKDKEWAKRKLNGLNARTGLPDKYQERYLRYRFLLDAPFIINDACCYHIKKAPLNKYRRDHGVAYYLGTMATESLMRRQAYYRHGCNSYKSGNEKSAPLSFWTENDIWEYIRRFDVPYCEIYDMGHKRTGCMFCMYGCHLEKEPNRFQKMKLTHPKQYDYCINKLGLGEVLDYVGIPYV